MQRSCVRVAMSRAENAKRAGKLQSFGVTTMPRVRFYPGSAMLSKWRTAKIVTLVPKNGCCWERKLMLPSERALPSLFQGPSNTGSTEEASMTDCGPVTQERNHEAGSSMPLHHLRNSPTTQSLPECVTDDPQTARVRRARVCWAAK